MGLVKDKKVELSNFLDNKSCTVKKGLKNFNKTGFWFTSQPMFFNKLLEF